MRRLLLVLAFVPLPACAWTRVSDQQIAQMSAELAPPDLRLLIQRFPREYARGLDRAFADAGEIHGTNLRQSTERETRKIVAMIRTNQPMSAVVDLYYYIWREAGGDVRPASFLRGRGVFANGN